MISQSQETGRVSALTFDDGPNGRTTSRLLDFLGAHQIRATFCLVGANIRAAGGRDLVRRMTLEGHVLANHSTNHSDMGGWSRAAIRADLRETLAIVREALGDEDFAVPFFRAPFGEWGHSESVAAEMGMQSLAVLNTINDWNTQDPHLLAKNLRLAMKPGEIVIAHDGGGDREGTVDAVIAVVTERLAEGWSFALPAMIPGTPLSGP